MITDDEIELAVAYLRDSARAAAQARAERIYVEAFSKVLKAQLMTEHAELPVNAQEREAYSHEKYGAHLQALREAVLQDENFRFLREAASAKIEAWRTQQANHRAEGKAYS